MAKPIVTIITVVYNDVAHIEETMLSVLNQTYASFEYVVIDGGSSDGTVDVIRKYADRLAYWVSEKDGGIYPAMNKGLAHVSGQWVNFMNSGDSFADNRVLEDIFSGTVDLQGKVVIGGHAYKVFSDSIEEMYAMEAHSIPTQLPFCHQSTFVKVNDKVPLHFDSRYRIAADYKLLYDLYEAFGPEAIAVVDRFVSNYRMTDSTTFVNMKRTKKEYLIIQSKHISWCWIKEAIKYLVL